MSNLIVRCRGEVAAGAHIPRMESHDEGGNSGANKQSVYSRLKLPVVDLGFVKNDVVLDVELTTLDSWLR